jgi:hypothetical protein
MDVAAGDGDPAAKDGPDLRDHGGLEVDKVPPEVERRRVVHGLDVSFQLLQGGLKRKNIQFIFFSKHGRFAHKKLPKNATAT